MSEELEVTFECRRKLSMIYCTAFLKWHLSQGNPFMALPGYNEWSKTVGWPCQVNTVCLCHRTVCQSLEQLLVFACSLTLSELLWRRVIFYCCWLGFLCFLLSLLAAKCCVRQASTEFAPRTSSMPKLTKLRGVPLNKKKEEMIENFFFA